MNSSFFPPESISGYQLLDIAQSRPYKRISSELSNWDTDDISPEIDNDQSACSGYCCALRKDSPSLNDWITAIRSQKKSEVTQFSTTEKIFDELVENWHQGTALMSSVNLMAMHPAYQRIIGMGREAIPLILKELEKQPDHWFWALNAITGDNPVDLEDEGDIGKMSDAWLKYGKDKGFIA